MPFDLSKVIFVATANRMQPIPPPLLDRMEVIELPGYTAEEKLRIAMQHLIPRVLDQHGLSSAFLQIPEVFVTHVFFMHFEAYASILDNIGCLVTLKFIKICYHGSLSTEMF